MTNKKTHEPNELKISALIRTLETDTLEPDAAVLDAAVLDALRIRAAAKFEEEEEDCRTSLETRPADRTALANHNRRKPMLTFLASRGLASVVALASAIALWLNLSPTTSALNTTPFSRVLSELRRASSLQLKISKDGQSADVWVRPPGLVRWEESPQRYTIAAGSRLWKIDETENTSVESNSPWFPGPQEQIDLLGLLNAGVSDASRLLDARPVEQITRDGRECLVYRVALPTGKGNVAIEASADAKRLQLVEILARKSGSKRTGPPLAEMQDASISGFGMWIGNDLIEADVVEKQRAREIYETILREKRDPGLLEWTGGNSFKARVFPIEARSEKRIKVVYTQVLPLRANRYRYAYRLRSELLRTSPLRELSLTVTVNSAMALKSVTCPTHAARIVGFSNRDGTLPEDQHPSRSSG